MKRFKLVLFKKRDIIWISVMFIIFMLVKLTPSILSSLSDIRDSHKVGNEMAEKILYALSNDDSNSIIALLCEKTKQNYPIDQQITEAFEFVEGKIISHGNISIGEGISSTSIFKTDWQDISVYVNDIKTDNDKSYFLRYYAFLIHSEIKNIIGISNITIVERDFDKKEISRVEIGECYDKNGNVIK